MSNKHLKLNIPNIKLVIFLHNPHLTASVPVFLLSMSCKSILSISQAETLTPLSLTTQSNPSGKKFKYIQNPITSHNLHCYHHQLLPGLLSELPDYIVCCCKYCWLFAIIHYPFLLCMWVVTFPSSICSLLWHVTKFWTKECKKRGCVPLPR